MLTTTDIDALAELDAHAQAACVASAQCSPEDLVLAAIARIERWNPRLNAISERNFERAIERARCIDRSRPFAGVPIVLKDSTEHPGLDWRSGSRAFAQRRGERRQDFVGRLEDAGLIVVGKSNMPEGGLLPSTEGLLLGPAHNPWDPAFSSGGSSGGAAVAVSCGMVPLAQGSDGGGSIRIPAACCGVFGLKPSRGRQVRIREAHWLEDLLVTDLPLTRSVRDAAAMLATIEDVKASGFAPLGLVKGPSRRRLVIGVNMRNLRGAEPDGSVRAAIEDTARLCRDLGHEVCESTWPFEGAPVLDQFVIIWSRIAHDFAAAAAAAACHLEPWTSQLAEHYRRSGPGTLASALDCLGRLRASYDRTFASVDVVLSPVTRTATPALGAHAPTRRFDELLEAVFDFVSYTPLHNLAGAPAMSIPSGFDPRGLPMGMMFASRCGDEATLLELAYEMEAARPWPLTQAATRADIHSPPGQLKVPPSSSIDVL